MRNSRDRWTFFKNEHRQALSAIDVQYWKSNLKKILKVGKEFEFNLPNSIGNCKGDNNNCPCVLMDDSSCWMTCTNIDNCEVIRSYTRCENYNKLNCKNKNCNTCISYTFRCNGINCSSFESNCFNCNNYKVDCASCKHLYIPEKNPKYIRNEMMTLLKPNNTYGNINKSGVHSIVQDGSLLGDKGMEIVTIGRRIDYWEFYKMAKRIISAASKKEAYTNERCSIHMHLLASYYSKLRESATNESIPNRISEMEKPLPEIILANFHQLCRRYQNAITWMAMGLDDPNHMTRWEKFRVSILKISPVTNTMRNVIRTVADNSGGNKYGWVNYNNIGLDMHGDINRLHIEMRVLDGIMSPSAVASFACMYYALLIKAVEISRYGLLEVGNEEWMKQTILVKQALLNNMKHYNEGDRFADTSTLYNYYEILIRESLDLIRQLKHILIKVGCAYQVLEKIAERPIALRRCDGEDWETIEKSLEVQISPEDEFSAKVDEVIDLRLIDECKNVSEWIEEVGKALSNEANHPKKSIINNIEQYVENLCSDGELIWSNTLGAMARI